MTTRPFGLIALVTLVMTAAACSSDSSSTALSPSAAASDTSVGGDAAARGIDVGGSIARIGGSCPALRFVVGRVTVQTSRATAFVGGPCESLATGVTVAVNGARQSDGTLSANSVTRRAVPTR